MANAENTTLHGELVRRKQTLETVISGRDKPEHLLHLLKEVDLALEKMSSGTFGSCESCHEPIEQERLFVDPLIRNCLDHLTHEEQRTLERDLDLAYQIQGALLPKQNITVGGWTTAYHYEGAGPVSGDYCDLITPEGESDALMFLIGDVSGKGVAASMLMAHLHASFRSLMKPSQPVNQLVAQVNRLFCEGTMSTHFATLVCGRANSTGEVEICNAGHCPPLLVRGNEVQEIPSTDLPIGVFCAGYFSSKKVVMNRGDTLVLFSDGLSESENRSNAQYGYERLASLASRKNGLSPRELIAACLEDLRKFRSGAPKTDDLTLMVVQRIGLNDAANGSSARLGR